MHTLIKICGLTNADDAKFAADAGADLLGFIFAQGSPRRVEPETVRDIVKQLPANVKKVGVFRDAANPEIIRIMDLCGLDIVQLHGHETPETAKVLALALRGLQETRVATREESGVLGFPSRRGLTPRGSLECNPEIPAFPGEEY